MAHPLETRLTAKQIAPTAMRLLVLELLQRQTAAVSLADVEQQMEHADRITLHRTLKTFADKGLVHRIEDGSGAVKYALCEDACTPRQHHDLHVHFHCQRCQQTICLPDVAIPPIQVPAAFQVQDMGVVLKGLCDRCSAR
ncbi:Fur family transcriptional regulator [Hymenobacter jeollabukensis]|uniref:Transcriptional repressor n=1 Tax=Hymenobacter jeollabukensis TaxID=2025313 RepID=A0A5R8WJ64_9BACT|nr:transcriptional repressor [Hymenobacter jeollabukensis]TLM88747.1 transcriptional repressor [Hymenobacter jeollabukensis]